MRVRAKKPYIEWLDGKPYVYGECYAKDSIPIGKVEIHGSKGKFGIFFMFYTKSEAVIFMEKKGFKKARKLAQSRLISILTQDEKNR